MKGIPKKNTTLRLEESVKETAATVLMRHRLMLTEGIEEYLAETILRGEPAVRKSVDAHIACERIKFEALRKHTAKAKIAGKAENN